MGRALPALIFLTAPLIACGRLEYDPVGDAATDSGASDGGASDGASDGGATDGASDGGAADGASDDAGPDAGGDAGACTWGPLSAPMLVPGVNTVGTEWSSSISADGLTIYFEREGAVRDDWDVYVATRSIASGAFAAAMRVPGVATDAAAEQSPSLSADGLSIYFSRPHPTEPRAAIWVSTRTGTDQDFGDAVLVPGLDTSGVNRIAPSISGETRLVHCVVDGSVTHLEIATRPDRTAAFVVERALDEVNLTTQTCYPALSQDGLELFFEGGTPYGIAVARRASTADPFSAPETVDTLGGGAGDPDLSPDGRTLYFTSNRAGSVGGYDLWYSTRACL
jgi:hypothetical protein